MRRSEGSRRPRKLLAGAAVSGTKADPAKKAARKRRRLGAEGRARIVEAQLNLGGQEGEEERQGVISGPASEKSIFPGGER
jgi:hypothetical protein